MSVLSHVSWVLTGVIGYVNGKIIKEGTSKETTDNNRRPVGSGCTPKFIKTKYAGHCKMGLTLPYSVVLKSILQISGVSYKLPGRLLRTDFLP